MCSSQSTEVGPLFDHGQVSSSASGTVAGGLMVLVLVLCRWLRTRAVVFEGAEDTSRGDLGRSPVVISLAATSVGIGWSFGTKLICLSKLLVLECSGFAIGFSGLFERVRIRDMTGEIVSV